MSPDRWKKIKECFVAAVDLAPAERGKFLEQIERDDALLRAEVQKLLDNDARNDGFLREPDASQSTETAGQRVGAYRLIRQIGAGGMGSVWLAERADEQFTGRVAVKLIRRGLDDRESIHRFRQERQLLANLQHPNISRLLDGGVTPAGGPYLIMEYVDGQSIDLFCDAHKLSVDDRLELFRAVCSAVQFAHQNLIVHRDLKPGNILVNETGSPTLLDFGIAKLLNPADLLAPRDATVTAQRFLTPGYASPEQIKGEPITTASDIYSLGLILYRLLTAHAPYRLTDDSLTAFERAICEQPPILPSASIIDESMPNCGLSARQLRSALRGDLDTIALMALRKEPQRRYRSAEQLSDDVRNYLRGLPVIARPDTFAYRANKFVRRNRLPVALAASVFVLLAVFAIVTKVQSSRLAAQTKLAEERYQQTQQVAGFQAEMLSGINADAMGQLIVSRMRAAAENELGFRRVQNSDGTLRPLTPDEIAAALKSFDQTMTAGKATDVARDVMDASVLTPAVEALARRFGDQPEIEAKLRFVIASIYQSLGRSAASEAQFRRVIELQRQLLGPESIDLSNTLSELAESMRKRRDLDAAEPICREALAMRRRLLGEENLWVAASLDSLGLLLTDRGDLAQAEPLLRHAIDIYRKAQGNDSLGYQRSVHNLAGLLIMKRDLSAAEQCELEAIALARKNGNKTSLASCLNGLTGVYFSQGKYTAAEAPAREALETYSRTVGDGHTDTIDALNNLAGIYLKEKRFDEAEPLARRALAGRAITLPESHWLQAASRIVLSDVLVGKREYARAEPLLLSAWQNLKNNPGASPEFKKRTLGRLIALFEATGQSQRAEEFRTELAKFPSPPAPATQSLQADHH